MTLIVSCSDSHDSGQSKSTAKELTDKERYQQSLGPVVPLNPLFEKAKSCFERCSGKSVNYQMKEALRIPYYFADYLRTNPSATEKILAMLSHFGVDYKNLLLKDPGESEFITLEGSVSYSMTVNNEELYIYTQAGYKHSKIREEINKRPIGNLNIAIKPKTNEVAILFNGNDDLSEYLFAGEESLLAPLLAYEVGEDVAIAIAYSKNPPEFSTDWGFPLDVARHNKAVQRLTYLNEKYIGGKIVGAESVYAEIDKAKALPKDKQWWTPDSSFTMCMESKGPASKLDEFIGFTDKPRTEDFRDSSGHLTKVEVINYLGDGKDIVWTYYKDKSDCEREQVNRAKSAADRYR